MNIIHTSAIVEYNIQYNKFLSHEHNTYVSNSRIQYIQYNKFLSHEHNTYVSNSRIQYTV